MKGYGRADLFKVNDLTDAQIDDIQGYEIYLLTDIFCFNYFFMNVSVKK